MQPSGDHEELSPHYHVGSTERSSLKIVPKQTRTGEHHREPRHHSADCLDPDPHRRAAHLGPQPELGLWAEWGHRPARRDPDHPIADGPYLTARTAYIQAMVARGRML